MFKPITLTSNLMTCFYITCLALAIAFPESFLRLLGGVSLVDDGIGGIRSGVSIYSSSMYFVTLNGSCTRDCWLVFEGL